MQWTATGLPRPKSSMPPSRKHYNRIRDLVRVHEDRDNPKGSGSERARADKIVRDYLSELEQDSTADTFPMIGLPNDISRPDRAVRQAFEGCA